MPALAPISVSSKRGPSLPESHSSAPITLALRPASLVCVALVAQWAASVDASPPTGSNTAPSASPYSGLQAALARSKRRTRSGWKVLAKPPRWNR